MTPKPFQLQQAFRPRPVTVTLPCGESQLDAAEAELRAKSERDENECYGYFPGMRGKGSVDSDLPACEQLAEAVPTLEVEGKMLDFNFIRLSLIQQHGDAPFHLDSDAATALTGNTTTVSERLVWRLLLNTSDRHERRLAYIDIDPELVVLTSKGGYIHCEDKEVAERYKQTVTIPPRKGLTASGVLFCASRVLHTGQDDEHGHFVMGYGCEEPLK